ncbi:hypothetical protein [Spirochaeta cellobiosiphila]|uniref:hypothetical protein n=1 Tax=Spirochaeta cellobiosiphila TaxID=504483 RepID=UPI000564A6EE|nr:hypothetical protein [Spirochaeta cellobiosiphila]
MSVNIVDKIDDTVKVKNVLISVSDKSHLDVLIEGLIMVNKDIKIYSTGGTYSKIKEILGDRHSNNLVSVSEYTGQPEMQGGLVKTLDFKIYLGLLSETYNEDHVNDIRKQNAVIFDMVVVNLYPFQQTIAKEKVTIEEARSNIDIGGPTMLRASAKNYLRVASVCNPSKYNNILKELTENKGGLSFNTRFELAKETFNHTAEYDKTISEFLVSYQGEEAIKSYTIIK